MPLSLTGSRVLWTTILNSWISFWAFSLREPDESGRRRPVPKEGTEQVIEIDNVIAAIGQFPVVEFLTGNGVNMTRWNTIEVVDETIGETNVEDVFAGGDVVLGPSIAVEAIGAGRKAAGSIHLYLKGEEVTKPGNAITKETSLLDVDELVGTKMPVSERVKMPELEVDERKMNFVEVELGLDEEMAVSEAERRLNCGLICYKKEAQSVTGVAEFQPSADLDI